jgi:hypothetical protein
MLPETAPFPAEQIVALNSIISRTNAEQRTWLSGTFVVVPQTP